MSKAPVAAVVLAAGGSIRLGRPKQLVRVTDQPLVWRATKAALDAGCKPVVVVVGAHAEAVGAAVADLPVHRVLNRIWAQGVGTSISCGVRAIEAGQPAGCIVIPCDQPRLTPGVLSALIERFRKGQSAAVTCAYAGTIGPPTLFGSLLLSQVTNLQGDTGARRVLQECSSMATIEFPGGALDVNTQDDLNAL